jgi:NAD(P)-dependent dehydrogenase (short-subunit alcohol dehydrogenase family)
MLRFDGRVAVITGAGRGLGRAYALLLASRGASVVVNDADLLTDGSGRAGSGCAADVAAEIENAGGRAVSNRHSVADRGAAEALIETAIDVFGRVDILINNAGIQVSGPFPTLDDALFRKVMDVHFFGSVDLCREAWPHLLAAGQGRIVNTVSAAVFGKAHYAAYGAAKGALLAFTRALAEEGAPHGIKVNAIAPLAGTRMALETLPDDVAALMRLRMPVETPAAIVGYMAHECCAFTGEAITGCAGRASRFLLGEVEGFHDPALTPELVAENLDRIVTGEGFHAWPNTDASSGHQRALMAEGRE